MYWAGYPATPWGKHGWFLRPQGASGGKELPDPIRTSGPVVLALECDARVKEGELLPDDVKKTFQRMLTSPAAPGQWILMDRQRHTIHDSRHYGQLHFRLLPARDANTLTVVFDGSETSRVELPRKDGQSMVVRKTIKSSIAQMDFTLAFLVINAAADWPKPLEITSDSDGKEVAVKACREIVISLPGDCRGDKGWRVKKLKVPVQFWRNLPP